MHLFSSEAFIPHGHCYLWKTGLVWLHIIADASTAIAYYSIPIALIYFVRKRKDLPFNWIFFLFGAFIIACGTTHLMEIWTLWHPTYWLSGFLKAITAVVSLYTALALIPLVPKALALPSPTQLEKANKELEHEIIERKLVEDALRESEQRFHNAFDYAAIGMAIVALDGRWLQVNRSLCEIVGYCEQELLSTNFQAITHPDDLEYDLYYVNQLISGKIRYYQMEKRYFHSSGHIVWILLNASLVHDAQGQPLYFISQIQDITQRKQAEEELRHQKELLQTIFDHIPVMINFYDATGETLLVNRGVERLLGWSKAELQQIDRLAECYPDPKNHQRVLDFMREASGEWQDFKTRTKDGRILDTSWANIRLSDGTVIGIGSDISERKRAEAALQESEARYRSVVDHVKEVIFQTDAEGLWTFLNPAWAEIMEFTVEESIGTNFLNYIHPEDRQRNLELFQPLIYRQKDYYRHEIRYITKAGQVRWIEVFARLTLDANNNVIGTSGTLNDVTDRKQAEEQLRWQEALLRLMTNASPLAFYVVDNRSDAILYFNHRFCEIWGIEHLEAQMQRGILKNNDIIPDCLPLLEDVAAFAESCKPLQSEENRAVVEDEIRFVDERTIRRFSAQVRDEEDNYFGRLYIFEDITQRKQAEERLRLLERAVAASSNGIIISDAQAPDKPVIYVNSGFERITGYRKEDIIGKNCRCLQGTDTKQAALEELRRAMAEARESQVVLRNYRKDGSMFWNEFCLTPVRDETGYLTHFIGVQTDISEHKQAEEALRQSEERFRGLVNSAPVGIFQTDLLGDCLFVNSRWLEIAERSREETLGRGWENAIHPDERLSVFTQWYNAAARGREFAMECSFLTPQGKVKWAFVTAVPLRDYSGAITGYLGSVKDISDRKQAEEALRQSEVREREKAKELALTLSELKRTQAQLIQAEKMSSLGQMVAGIAHEINNPISFIYANLTPAKEYFQDLLRLIELYQQHYPSPIAEIAEQIEIIEPDFIKEDFPKLLVSMEEGADRISQIVWSLRNFSRLDEAECKQVDIHEGIENTLFILQHRLKPQSQRREIQVIKEYGQLPKVECYPSDLNQVFMNILCNAIDALDEFALSNQQSAVSEKSNNNGQLTADFRPTIRICTDVVGTSRVVIRIANNTDGIKAEVLPKIFDPFFTTKPPGKGKGLGLFIGYQIVVDKHGGELTCHSVTGQGTELTIELPIIQTKKPQTKEVYAMSTSIFNL